MKSQIKQTIKQLCPPVMWEAVRRAYRVMVPTPPSPHPVKFLSTTEELDEMIAAARKIARISQTDMVRHLRAHCFQAPPMPADPYSPEYREAQTALYRLISGRSDYTAVECENTPFDLEARLDRPFPHCTRDAAAVGEHLIAVGFLLQHMDLPRGGSVLEFGPGYGHTTVELAQLGADVTAVDIYAPFVELVRRRCQRLGRDVRVEAASMLDYEPGRRFDRVLFFECFHHCSDHVRMIRRLDDLVADGGAVVFAGEPVVDHLYGPWGLRLDGQSLWAIRLHGWLELGFRKDYFMNLLAQHGWRAEMQASKDVPSQSVIVARRK